MVKAVVGEESRLQLTEDRLSSSGVSSQVGLVIGKFSSSSDRCSVFELIPTPANDAGEPACSLLGATRDDKKKGSKGKSQSDSLYLSIDKEWVAEHACQVSRMLLGGLKVLGVYIWASESSFRNSTIELCQAVKVVAEAAMLQGTDWDERLLIHISYSPRRWACRNCMLTSNITSSSLRPCDFKMGKVLNSLQTFRCNYSFDLRLPICGESGWNFEKVVDVIRHGILTHAKELKGAKAIIDGNLVVEEDSCDSDSLYKVEFLLPFMKDTFVEACSQQEVLGVLVFSGSVCAFAYSNSKESVFQALDDLKGDIITSLLSRLDIMNDETDVGSGQAIDIGNNTSDDPISQQFLQHDLRLLRKRCSLPFPRRILIPWLGGTYICDYLQPCETIEVVKDHCVELMSMEAPMDASTILEPEVEPLMLSIKSFSDVTVPYCSTPCPESSSSAKEKNIGPSEGKKPTKIVEFNVLATILVLIFGILVGTGLYAVRPS